MILSICEDPKVLEIARLINIFVTAIRIVVPIVLIFALMFKLISAIMSDNADGLKKVLKIAPKNLAAAAIVFLIPSIVRLAVRFTSGDTSYDNCLKVVSSEEIELAYESKMEELMLRAEEYVDMDNYSVAYKYVKNVKDEDKRQEYEGRLAEVKAKIDEAKNSTSLTSTGLGADIVPNKDLIEACRWVLNSDDIQIKLYTCTNPTYQYKNPEVALPGGAIGITLSGAPTYVARKAITYSQYQYGLFAGEIDFRFNIEFDKMFAIMYRQVILHSIARREANGANMKDSNGVYMYAAGSCSQNYKQNLFESRYSNPSYKEIMDESVLSTKYFLLANESDGTLTEIRYNTRSGILGVMDKASKSGDFLSVLEAMKSGHELSYYYKDAKVYDCRNLVDDGTFDSVDVSVDKNIIYLGDSRISAFRGIKSDLGINDNKEAIFATAGAKYDERFIANMTDAKKLINSNKDKTYAITVNYGVNAKRTYKGFCNYYENFIKSIDKKHEFYIVSVNPFDESKVTAYKDDNTNAKVETFNDYMENTCISQIKSNVPDAKIYYCDVYNAIPLSEWAKRGYVSKDGIHYTTEGSKFIHNEIKKCIASHK